MHIRRYKQMRKMQSNLSTNRPRIHMRLAGKMNIEYIMLLLKLITHTQGNIPSQLPCPRKLLFFLLRTSLSSCLSLKRLCFPAVTCPAVEHTLATEIVVYASALVIAVYS